MFRQPIPENEMQSTFDKLHIVPIDLTMPASDLMLLRANDKIVRFDKPFNPAIRSIIFVDKLSFLHKSEKV